LKRGVFPRFDLILLGLGQDGHTASLFPGNPALLVKDRLVIATSQEGIAQQRITLTLPAINHADMIFFLVSGLEKAGIVAEVLKNGNKTIFPANEIGPCQGNICWFLDKDAASRLVLIPDTRSYPEDRYPKRIGVAADHEGYQLKEQLAGMLREGSYEVIDFGDRRLNQDDDYPDFVVPLARAVARAEVDRGVAICGSGVGACIAANKVAGVRACLIHEKFSARQGVEDDDMNVICLGSRVLDQVLAWELVKIFLASRFSGAERHRRRLAKVAALENK
jgi:ribose 5-phosphate isomerase B